MISLIGAVGSFLAAVLGLLNNALARRNEAHLAETKAVVSTLKDQTDGIKDELVRVTAREQRAAGKLEGKAEAEEEGSG